MTERALPTITHMSPDPLARPRRHRGGGFCSVSCNSQIRLRHDTQLHRAPRLDDKAADPGLMGGDKPPPQFRFPVRS